MFMANALFVELETIAARRHARRFLKQQLGSSIVVDKFYNLSWRVTLETELCMLVFTATTSCVKARGDRVTARQAARTSLCPPR